MNREESTREQLIAETAELRRQLAALQKTDGYREIVGRVREEIWKMERSLEVENLLTAMWEGLQQLEIPAMYCSINLLEQFEAPGHVVVYSISEKEGWRRHLFPADPTSPLRRIWSAQRPSYRPDIARDDPYSERPTLSIPLRSILDVPFRQGTLAVSSTRPQAFSATHIDFLEAIARVLSEGFQRMEDLRHLENRNRALEAELEERRQIERALQQERDRARQYLDIAEIILVALDRQGAISMINPKGCRVLGYEEEELIGRNWFARCLPPDISPGIGQVFAKMMNGQLESVEYVENPVLTRQGEKRVVAWHNSLLKDANGEIVGSLSSGEDITERKRLEGELVRTQRLRAVGELAAGVSHNLNNLLTGILGPAQLLQRMTQDPAHVELIDDILTAAQRARDLVRDLHQSVRNTRNDLFQPIEVNSIVREVVQTTAPRWRDEPEAKGISIEVEIDPVELPPVRGTSTGLHEVLTNLIFNAVDAMPKGGTISIRTRPAPEGVRIDLADTGIGMSEDVRLRLFEPFFTTQLSVGTGLGLSTAYATIAHWGGQLSVESSPGQGSIFSLHLPLWDGPLVKESPVPSREETQPQNGRLLLIDDDENVRRLLVRWLSKDNRIEALADSKEALERFTPGAYEVAFIDLGMPGVPGDQVARHMRRQDPALVTVLITGWELSETDPRCAAFDFALQKPFVDLELIDEMLVQAFALHRQRRREESAAV